jgi:putative polymerase
MMRADFARPLLFDTGRVDSGARHAGAFAVFAVLAAAMVFNAVLAFLNGHVTPISQSAVIGSEMLLVAVAWLLALLYWSPGMAPWVLLAGFFVQLAILRTLLTGTIELKYARDIMLIPTFAVLGIAAGRTSLLRIVLALHVVVFAVFLFEAIAPGAYADLFRIEDYYIATRGNRLDDFYNPESTLFISATRPDERFLSFIDAPRLSSVFLEPVSLGNYCSIVIAFACAFARRLGLIATILLLCSAVIMLVGCDGRLAIVSSALIVVVIALAPRLPRKSAAIYLPGGAVAAFALVLVLGWKSGTDDFSGRLAHTVELISGFNASDWLGISNTYVGPAMDSGLAYLIVTQSIIGLVVTWAWISAGAREDTAAQVRFTHALCLYIALTMLVSYSFVTIKTAALLWVIQGALQGSTPSQHGAAPFAAATSAKDLP